jgi:hypothetical protein
MLDLGGVTWLRWATAPTNIDCRPRPAANQKRFRLISIGWSWLILVFFVSLCSPRGNKKFASLPDRYFGGGLLRPLTRPSSRRLSDTAQTTVHLAEGRFGIRRTSSKSRSKSSSPYARMSRPNDSPQSLLGGDDCYRSKSVRCALALLSPSAHMASIRSSARFRRDCPSS